MKICHISTVHPLFDDRIFYKQCKTLYHAGHNVHLIIQHTKTEEINGIHIHGLATFKSRFNRFLKGNWISFKKALRISADIYQLHDPELMPCGILLKLFRKKVIFDFHEFVYYQLESKEWMNQKWKIKIIKALYSLIERIVISWFDALILAEDGYKEYFNHFYKKFQYKFFFIRNYAVLSFIDNFYLPIPENSLKRIIYLGSISRDRGIKEVIMTLELIKFPVKFILLGKWEDDDYFNECKILKGWEKVDYLGFKKLDVVYKILNTAYIGIVMLYPIKNYLTSLPVKAFEYLAMKKPMIMSNFSYWQDVFSNCALFANPRDPEDIAKKIQLLLSDKKLYMKFADAGRKLVEDKFNWENESINYLKVIEFVLQK